VTSENWLCSRVLVALCSSSEARSIGNSCEDYFQDKREVRSNGQKAIVPEVVLCMACEHTGHRTVRICFDLNYSLLERFLTRRGLRPSVCSVVTCSLAFSLQRPLALFSRKCLQKNCSTQKPSPASFMSITDYFTRLPPYATIVLAVALSYLHVGGSTPTVL
jgi:hypothetical protein